MNIFRRTAILVLPLLASLAATPALAHNVTNGSGRSVSETRSVGEFQAVSLAGSMDLQVRQGAQQQVQVTADDNLLPLLETAVETTGKGTTLVVRWRKGENIYHHGKVVVAVVVPKLTAVSASGSGDIRVESFNTPTLQVTLSGSSDARFDGLTTDDLGVRISGSGNVVGKGTAGKVAVNISGSGDVRFGELRGDDVQVTIAGSGDAAVNAQKTLNVRIAGSGDVSYVGNPALTSKIAGSGSVSRK